MIAVIVPVLARPWQVAYFLESLHEATRRKYRAVFVCSPGDDEEIETVRASDADLHVTDWPAGPGDYARKINAGYRFATEPWIFQAADDLAFCVGWDDEALSVAEQTGAGVIGTNDLSNSRVIAGQHATHSLVARWYADEHGVIDQPGAVLCERYAHTHVDDELVETAKARGLWAFAERSHVEHCHPDWRKGTMDDTYAKGKQHFNEDRALLAQRRKLWA